MSLSLDPRTTALVLIDVQKGILASPLAPYGAEQIVQNTAALARRFVEMGGTVILVRVMLSRADMLRQPVDVPRPAPAGGFPGDWADFPPEIASLHADCVITKRQWSAFYGTELDLQLRRRGITTVVLGGVATNFGVESTAREAWQHNYSVILAEDACTSFDANLHKVAMEKILTRLARVRSTKQILEALSADPDVENRTAGIQWPNGFAPHDADLFAHSEIFIEAPCSTVWRHLVEASKWPQWYPNSRDVKVLNDWSGVLQKDSHFEFSTFGVHIDARVAEFDPVNRIGWFGKGAGLEAFHTWLLVNAPRGCQVVTEKVAKGPSAIALREPDPLALQKGHDLWLNRLKLLAEQ